MNDTEIGSHLGLLHQQTALARFGELALRSDDLDEILTEACRLVGDALGTELAKVMELQEDGETLRVRAGIGWKPGIVGEVTIKVAEDTSEGHALKTGEPAISCDIETETRFRYPAFLTDNGVRALANVVIIGAKDQPPFGILQVDSRHPREFTDDDTAFLSSYANLLAAAVDRRRIMDEAGEREAKLRASLARQQAALETGLIGFFEWDVQTGTVTTDKHFAGFYGLDPTAAATGVPLAEVMSRIHPTDRAAVEAIMGEALAVPADYTKEFRLVHAGGEVRWVHVRGHCYGCGDGNPLRYIGTATDVTASKAAEAALRTAKEALEAKVVERTAALQANEARLRTIFETSYQLQALLASDGTVVDANATSLAVMGATLDDVVGRPFWDTPWFTATPGMTETMRAAVAAVARGESVRLELSLAALSGPRSFDFSIRPVRDESGQVVAMVPEAVDITERRQAEDQLRQSHKMEAVGQLTGGIAHDFNNLLAGISGALELIRSRAAQGRTAEFGRYIDAALTSADRAAALTHRLLAFSRRQTLDPKPTDLSRLATGMEDLIRRTVEPAIVIEMRVAGGLWPALCDPNQLESALLNLVINARDAMPDGGRLAIETANAVVSDQQATPRGVPPGDYVALSVTDTGTGMAPGVMARAFDPFFTTKQLGRGTGLGLSMIYGFVQQSGGHVRLRSTEGQGTTVTIYLPRHLGAVDREDVADPAAQPVTAKTAAAVLVVEDEPAVRMIIAEVLTDLGYTVLEAADGSAGLSVVEGGTRIDLLLTDVGLPGGMNGRQLADAARQRRPGLKVLFVTGYDDTAAVRNGLLDEGMEVMTKPFAVDALIAKVQGIVSG